MNSIAKWMTSIIITSLLAFGASIEAQKEDIVHDEDIKVADFVELEYPRLAQSMRIQGVVVVRAQLDDRGNVISSTAISGSKELIPACVENVKKWHFRPTSAKTAIIVYRFHRDENFCTDPCHSLFLFQPPNFVSITVGSGMLQY
jgi:TonB family protein